MKIAIITPGFLPVPAVSGGAVENLIEFLIEGNESSDNLLDVYTIYDSNLDKCSYKNTSLIYVKTNIFDKIISVIYNRFFRFLSFYNKTMKENYISSYGVNIFFKLLFKKYDYILIENNLSVVNILKHKKNIIYHLHNDIFGVDKPKYQCKIALEKCCKIISVSEYIKNRLLSINKKYGNKIDVLPNCIDVNKFIKVNTKKNNDFLTFFYSGRIVPEKGVLELIKAYSILEKKYTNIELMIVGKSIFNCDNTTNYENEIKEYIKLNDIKRIVFTGFVSYDKMPNYLSLGDCVIIPSLCEESFGLVALEAMALHKPIIATKSGGMVEVINESCSLFVDKNNIIEELVMQMEKMILDKKLLKKYGDEGYKILSKNPCYFKKNYYNQFLKIIDKENVKNESSSN